MKIMQEVTQWSDNTPNHIYIFDDKLENILAYVPEGSNKVSKFRSPISIDKRNRKFELIDDQPTVEQRVVEGSKGQRYTLTKENGQWTCSCPGFTYYGKCKHQSIV